MERDFDDAASVGDIIIENDPGDVAPSGGSLLGNVSAVVGDAPSQQAGGGLMEDDRQSTHSDQEEPPPQDEGERRLRKN